MGLELTGPNSSLSTQAAADWAPEKPEPSSSTTTESRGGQPAGLEVRGHRNEALAKHANTESERLNMLATARARAAASPKTSNAMQSKSDECYRCHWGGLKSAKEEH